MDAKFPCEKHENQLKEKIKKADWNWEKLSTEDRSQWYSYRYAWRQFALGLSPDDHAPFDPQRTWYDRDLVEEALRAYEAGLIASNFGRQRQMRR